MNDLNIIITNISFSLSLKITSVSFYQFELWQVRLGLFVHILSTSLIWLSTKYQSIQSKRILKIIQWRTNNAPARDLREREKRYRSKSFSKNQFCLCHIFNLSSNLNVWNGKMCDANRRPTKLFDWKRQIINLCTVHRIIYVFSWISSNIKFPFTNTHVHKIHSF